MKNNDNEENKKQVERDFHDFIKIGIPVIMIALILMVLAAMSLTLNN
jgi:hypothetical protein